MNKRNTRSAAKQKRKERHGQKWLMVQVKANFKEKLDELYGFSLPYYRAQDVTNPYPIIFLPGAAAAAEGTSALINAAREVGALLLIDERTGKPVTQ